MLHRMRMQSFLQVASSSSLPSSSSDLSQTDITGSFPFSTSFSQSAFSFDNEYAHFAQDGGAPDFQWDQDSMDTSLASSLSLDLLLSMGASQNAAESAAAASVSAATAAAASMMDTDQQGLFNLGQLGSMPFGSFSEDYPQGVPVAAATDACVSSCSPSMSSSSALSSLSSPALVASQCNPMIEVVSGLLPPTTASASLLTQSSLPVLAAPSSLQPSYYELLMSAGQTEPLSQLLSTNAASISSPTFLVASKGDDTTPNTPMAAGKVDINSGHANDTPSTYILAAFPLSNGSPQRTAPLTTREIMDALSGNFPPQVIPAIIESDQDFVPAPTALEPHRQQGTELPLQKEGLRDEVPSSEIKDQIETPESLSEEAVPELEEDRQTPERDQRPLLTDMGEEDEDPSSMDLDVDEDLSLGRMTLRSPPVSPRKRPAAGPKRSLKSRKVYSKSMKEERLKSSTRYPSSPSSRARRSRKLEETDLDPAELAKRHKRRRPSEDSSSDSGPESAPSSPKTPPSHDGHDHPLLHHQDKPNRDGISANLNHHPHHLQTLSDLNLNMDLGLLPSTNSPVGQMKGTLHHHHPLAAMNVEVEGVINLNHMEDDDGAEAGILSTSVHTRYPSKRQSARLLNRVSSGQHDHLKYRSSRA